MNFRSRFSPLKTRTRWLSILILLVALGPFLTAQSFCPAGMAVCEMEMSMDAPDDGHKCALACAVVLTTLVQILPDFQGRVGPAASPSVILTTGHVRDLDLRPPIDVFII